MSRFRLIISSIPIIVVMIYAYLAGVSVLDVVEIWAIDFRFDSRGSKSPSPNVVLAVIDERSLDQEGPWPWPRSKMAELIGKLSEARARVIAFDLVFSEPSMSEPTIDRMLSDSIEQSSTKVVLGYFFHRRLQDVQHLDKKEIRLRKKNIQTGRYTRVINPFEELPNELEILEVKAPESNITNIATSASYSGFFNALEDKHGVTRHIPAVLQFQNDFYAPLSLMTVSAYLDSSLMAEVGPSGIKKVQIGSSSIPVNKHGMIMINYRGRDKTFPHISITDILSEQTPNEILRDKIVLVGGNAVGIGDLKATPFSTFRPGVEIHATVIDSVLSKDFLQKPGWANVFNIMAIVVLGLFMGLVISMKRVIKGVLVFIIIIAGHIMLCQYLFSEKGLVLNIVYPLTTVFLVYMGVLTYDRYLKEKIRT